MQTWRIDELEKIVIKALVLIQIGLSLGSLMVPIVTIAGDPPRTKSVASMVLGLLGMDERPISGTVVMVCLLVVLLATLVTVGGVIDIVSKEENSPGPIVAMIAGIVSMVASILALVAFTSLPLRVSSSGMIRFPDVDPTFPGWGLALAAFAGLWTLMLASAVRKIRG